MITLESKILPENQTSEQRIVIYKIRARINFHKKKKRKTNKPKRCSNVLLPLAPISFILLSIRGVAYTARLYADAMLHNTKASSVDSLSPLPTLSLCILSSPLQRLTSYFLTSRNRATPHVFPNHFLNRKMTFSSSIYDRVPLQLVIFERLQSARHSSLYILIYRACIIGDTIKINPSNTTLIYIHPFIDSEYRNERKN